MLSRSLLSFLCLSLTSAGLLAQNGNPVVRFNTDLGNIDVTLLRDVAPNTVANFLRYVNRSDYNGSFIHRSAVYAAPSTMRFVIQGGGYKFVNGNTNTIPADPPVANEFFVSNKRGTLAMAKVSGDPNSATNQWFFNESDANAGPPSNLDTQNGGFTVFGRVISSSGLAVMDAIGALPTYNLGSPFAELPLRNYTSGGVQDANLVHLISLTVFNTTRFTITHPSATTFHLQCVGVPGAVYRLETSATPGAAGVTLAATVTADASGNISYDDNSPGTQKFYRLALP